jgi:hypothetical protein
VIVTNRITELSGTIVAADAHGAQAVPVIVNARTCPALVLRVPWPKGTSN